MSGKVMGAIYDLDLPHPKQSILLALADHAAHDGSNVYASVGLIAWKTGYSERQVQRIMHECETDGLLTIAEKATQHKCATYQIVISAGKRKEPHQGRNPVTPKRQAKKTVAIKTEVTSNPMPEVTSAPTSGDSQMSPITYSEPSEEPLQESQSVSLRSTDCTPAPTDPPLTDYLTSLAKHDTKPGAVITQGDKALGALGQSAPPSPPRSAPPPAPKRKRSGVWDLLNSETGEVNESFTDIDRAHERQRELNAIGGARYVLKEVKPTAKPKQPPQYGAIVAALVAAAWEIPIKNAPGAVRERAGEAAKIMLVDFPDTTAEQVQAFVQWYRSENPKANLPRDKKKIADWFGVYRSKHTPLDGVNPYLQDDYFKRRGDA